jgi:hypothetical protein
MNIVGIDCEHETDEGMAKEAVRTLVAHYPGHDWQVLIRGGVMHVKAQNIHPAWGMCLHYSQIKADANERARSIVRAAGEFLERAHLKRGQCEGSRVAAVEGIPALDMARVRP